MRWESVSQSISFFMRKDCYSVALLLKMPLTNKQPINGSKNNMKLLTGDETSQDKIKLCVLWRSFGCGEVRVFAQKAQDAFKWGRQLECLKAWCGNDASKWKYALNAANDEYALFSFASKQNGMLLWCADFYEKNAHGVAQSKTLVKRLQ